jgi:hypothetical protein
MKKAYRHGEIAFAKIDKLPQELQLSTNKQFLKGSHGNPHSYDNGELYLKEVSEYIFGYFVAKDTTLTHPEHGNGEAKLKTAKLPNGIYELRRAVEFINGELKQVID